MTETSQPETVPARRRRWVMPVLIASLALNLLIVGAMAGWAWRHGPRGHGGPGSDRILWLLPDAKRDQGRAIIDRYRQSDAARDTEWTASREAVLSALTAEPFARPALEQALSRLGSAELARRLDPAMLGEIAAILTLEERKELADTIKAFMDRRERWRGKP